MEKISTSKRETLKLIGRAWVTPTIITTAIPAHAQASGELCGGMEGVAGVWGFVFTDLIDLWALYPDGQAARVTSGRSAEWFVDGARFELFNIEERPGRIFRGMLNASCVQMTGISVHNQDPFVADKLDEPLP